MTIARCLLGTMKKPAIQLAQCRRAWFLILGALRDDLSAALAGKQFVEASQPDLL